MIKENKFETIFDAYQLLDGAKIRAKQNPEELFILKNYDAEKKGYMIYPFDDGVNFTDFGILITEGELINDYEVEELNATVPKIDIVA